jgi:hypothetical protein
MELIDKSESPINKNKGETLQTQKLSYLMQLSLGVMVFLPNLYEISISI